MRIGFLYREIFYTSALLFALVFFPSSRALAETLKKVQVESMPEGVKLEWTLPDKSKRSILVKSETGLPQSVSEGKVIYEGTGSSFVDTDIKPGKKYYYSVISVIDESTTREKITRTTRKIVEAFEQIPREAEVGVVAVGVSSQAIGMFTLFDSLGDLWLTLIRVSQVVLAALTMKKKEHWGIVYDWKDKTPLKNIPLNVLNEKGDRIEGAITDSVGRFGFLAEKGQYSVKVAENRRYAFDPSTYESFDIYGKVYKGDLIKVESEESALLKLNIPLMPKITEGEAAKNFIVSLAKLIKVPKFLDPILEVFFWLGLIFIVLTLARDYNWPSILIFSFYCIVVLVRVLTYLGSRDYGLVLDINKKTPVPFAVIKAVSKRDEEEPLGISVTNTKGNFYLLTPKDADEIVIKGRTLEGRIFHATSAIDRTAGVIKGTYFV